MHKKPAPASGDPKYDKGYRDRLLDEALKDTFPASDPPAIAMPH